MTLLRSDSFFFPPSENFTLLSCRKSGRVEIVMQEPEKKQGGVKAQML